MTEYGMGDEATIDEILNDVDTNKVSNYIAYKLIWFSVYIYISFNDASFSHSCAGWEHQLRRIC